MSSHYYRLSGLLGLTFLILTACTFSPPQKPALTELMQPVQYADVPGWQTDDLSQAWPAFMSSCRALKKKEEWRDPCSAALQVSTDNPQKIRDFFETFMQPYQVINADGSKTGLATGYYEPLLKGSRKRKGVYQTPLYRTPNDLLTIDIANVYPEVKGMRLRGRLEGKRVVPYFTRAEIEQSKKLTGQELLWVDDPLDAFFLQIQGSGRVYIAESKETVRVAYANQNGHPYRSIGRYLADLGELPIEQTSVQGIRKWLKVNPSRLNEVFNANPSYVFFNEEKLGDITKGPKGALGIALTPGRSVAVDPKFIPLGAPVFLQTTEPSSDVPIQRLMMAQDTGGAIRGAVRVDYFWGFGANADKQAGMMKQPAKIWVLLPKQAYKN